MKLTGPSWYSLISQLSQIFLTIYHEDDWTSMALIDLIDLTTVSGLSLNS
jgi:hypothetical protein